MANKYQEENTGYHLDRIIGSVPCSRHAADTGEACWNLGSNRGILRAICNKRAQAAGANGAITPYKNPAQLRAQKKEYSK